MAVTSRTRCLISYIFSGGAAPVRVLIRADESAASLQNKTGMADVSSATQTDLCQNHQYLLLHPVLAVWTGASLSFLE
jgi:hypothetical protein